MEKGRGERTDTLQTDKVFAHKEYIEREAVLALKKPFPTSKNSITLYQQYFISPTAVEKIPAADVVPVVRCKDCKYRQDDDFCGGRGWPAQLVPDDGYCDRGARKDGDGYGV